MKSSASAAGVMSCAGSSSRRRISCPTALVPGSRTTRAGCPRTASHAAARASCVLLPAPSGPSKATSPATALVPSTGVTPCSERDDRARGTLVDAVEDHLVHARHHLVEVLLRDRHLLVHGVPLHAHEQPVQLLLHLRRR